MSAKTACGLGAGALIVLALAVVAYHLSNGRGTQDSQAERAATEEPLAAEAAPLAEAARPAERRVFHILVAKRSEALAIRQEIVAGGDSLDAFRAAARKHSKDICSKPLGGELGWVHQGTSGPGSPDPAVTEAAFRLAPGKVSEPARTKIGWHLIRVSAARGAPSVLETAGASAASDKPEDDVAVPPRDLRAIAVVERYLKACGGREALAAIQDRTVELRESMTRATDRTDLAIWRYRKRGYKVREDWDLTGFDIQGLAQAYDGNDGW